MQDQIYIGKFSQGLKTVPQPFNIDNDAFPVLYNAYVWRQDVKRKRGTTLLGRLQRQIQSVLVPTLPWEFGPLALVADVGNLITGPWTQGVPPVAVTFEAGSSITPGSITVMVGGNTYTEPPIPDGTLLKNGVADPGSTINYTTGEIVIVGGGVGPLTGLFSYYPDLPVLGLEDFVSNGENTQFPLLIAFDPHYAYQVNQTTLPVVFYSVTYYKNTNNPFTWSNSDENQFWSTNYQSAFWVTNNKPGFHFKPIDAIASTSATTVDITITAHGLIVGDYLFINEVTGPLGTGSGSTQNQNINGMTGRVTIVVDPNNVTVAFDGTLGTSSAAFLFPVAGAGGIAQYLTSSIAGQDGIKWYDGDPTAGTGIPTGSGLGWVNFSPPLTATSVSINDQTSALYYLVGALAILPFKDRLLFFGPQIQSSTGSVIQKPLQDTVLWSWNGTPYYTALVPTSANISETFDPRAWYVDQTGFGGYLAAGISQPLVSVMTNEDVILIGFGGAGKKTRFAYTGDDLQPFLFYLINSEMPSSSTFSSVVLDRGGIDIGSYGITLTTQQSCQRIDLDIPDEVFEIQSLHGGQKRVNAIRDFFREWIYFSYPTGNGDGNGSWVYPSNTFLFNYRDNTWAILKENFTHHGTFRQSVQYSWNHPPALTWQQWNEPWNSGSNQTLFPDIIAGNPQGYVLKISELTGEGVSGYIAAIASNIAGNTVITSINHCVHEGSSLDVPSSGDYLSFGGATIGLVIETIDKDNFVVDIPFPSVANITNVTQATRAVVTLSYTTPVTPPRVNSYFVGQTVLINGVVGMIQLNGNTYTVLEVTPTSITLNVDSTGFTPYISGGTTTLVGYVGLGNYTRLIQPLIQTKQFPFYWEQGRKLRLGVQKYLLDRTDNGQVTLNMYLSQDATTVWNAGPIVPSIGVTNNSLIYTQTLFTCPESINIGLTPANINLQMPTASRQSQIWHRMNTSLIGDSVQVGITLSDVQMRNLTLATDEIVLQGIHLSVSPGPLLS